MVRRNTIQKELVLEAVRSLRKHATADEVYEYIHAAHPTIGKGTVYRNLNLLAQDGAVRRVAVPDGPDRFDFTLEEHYHVKCVNCGEVSDVDLGMVPDLLGAIRNRHGMEFYDYDILFRGLCINCQSIKK